MIDKILSHYENGKTPKLVWFAGRPFTFLIDITDKYHYAAVSAAGTLTLFQIKPEVMEFEKRWCDGYPYGFLDIAMVKLDDDYDWKLSLTEIIVEDIPSIQELYEGRFNNG